MKMCGIGKNRSSGEGSAELQKQGERSRVKASAQRQIIAQSAARQEIASESAINQGGWKVRFIQNEKMTRLLGLVLTAAAVMVQVGCGMEVTLNAVEEKRRVVSIEEFAFVDGGTMHIQVADFKFRESGEARAGFIAIRASNEQGILDKYHTEMQEEYSTLNRTCPFDDPSLGILFSIEFKNDGNEHSALKDEKIGSNTEGIYEISFVRCGLDVPVSFHFQALMKNPNSLVSAGSIHPSVLFGFCFAYIIMLVMWIRIIRKNAIQGNVHKIHHLFTAFMILKIMAIFSSAVDQHYQMVYGTSLLWNILSHFLTAMKALMFFVVVILVGSGWSLIRPALDDKEKKILMGILPLQLLANVALVIADELPHGSSAFMKWKNLFQLFDIICCFVVAIPLFSHIQRLEQRIHEGKTNDSKHSIELSKLKQFRMFYLLVLAYIYFTRVIVFLVGNSVNFKQRYLEVVFTEIASIVFYVLIANSFRPTPRAQYLHVSSSASDNGYQSDEDDNDIFDRDMYFEDEHRFEFGLRDNVEMTSPTVPPSNHTRQGQVAAI